jgi:hypothetical protein
MKQSLTQIFTESGVQLERVFREFDEDRNGAISKQELRHGLSSLGTDLTPEQVDDFFDILDQDGDGEIDYVEFAQWFGSGPPPPPALPQVKEMQANQRQGVAALRAVCSAGIADE